MAFMHYFCEIVKNSIVIKSSILLFLLIFSANPLLSMVDKDTIAHTKFQKYLSEIYSYPNKVENFNIMSFNTGVSLLSVSQGFRTKLARTYLFELRYGYIRFNEDIDAPGRVYLANEYIYIQSNSAHLKPNAWQLNGLPTDSWRFGFAFRNGYGYILGENKYLTFNHTGAINWSRIDVEWPSLIDSDQKVLDRFDEQFRFGIEFESGVSYSVADFLQLDLAYNHAITTPDLQTFPLIGSSLLELAIQRTIDYIAYDYIWQKPDETPIANFIVKNLISYVFYELRRYNQHWPFVSDVPLNFDSFRIGCTFVF